MRRITWQFKDNLAGIDRFRNCASIFQIIRNCFKFSFEIIEYIH